MTDWTLVRFLRRTHQPRVSARLLAVVAGRRFRKLAWPPTRRPYVRCERTPLTARRWRSTANTRRTDLPALDLVRWDKSALPSGPVSLSRVPYWTRQSAWDQDNQLLPVAPVRGSAKQRPNHPTRGNSYHNA